MENILDIFLINSYSYYVPKFLQNDDDEVSVIYADSLADVQLGELVNYDSLSGFPLYVSKDIDGMLVVNRIRSEIVDVRKKEIVVHVMDGVIMDAEFEQSVLAEDDTEED